MKRKNFFNEWTYFINKLFHLIDFEFNNANII